MAIGFALVPIRIDDLAEIAFLVEQSYANHWRIQIASRLEVVARQHSEPAREIAPAILNRPSEVLQKGAVAPEFIQLLRNVLQGSPMDWGCAPRAPDRWFATRRPVRDSKSSANRVPGPSTQTTSPAGFSATHTRGIISTIGWFAAARRHAALVGCACRAAPDMPTDNTAASVKRRRTESS